MKCIKKFNLKEFNSYRVESICSKAWFPENENDFLEIYQQIENKVVILGNGNNIILSKEHYKEDFIILNGCFDKIIVNNTLIEAEAGATLLKLSTTALNHDLTGLELFYDIPSSVGGAVVMNAGTNDVEIKDIIVKVRYLDFKNSNIREIENKLINFDYRNSFFQKHNDNIVLKAWFQLEKGRSEDIHAKMEFFKNARWQKQPREYPNCGSVFKRPPGKYVGPMLDDLGLKGLTFGGAKVSDKHSGFIINTGNATGQDIVTLISEIQKRVKEHFGITLEVEQKII